MPYNNQTNRPYRGSKVGGFRAPTKSTKNYVRQVAHQTGYQMFSRATTGPVDPPFTSNDIIVTKVVRLTSNIPQSAPRNITISQVLNQLKVPNEGVMFRFMKISVWSQSYANTGVVGSDSETLSVTIPDISVGGAIPGGDGASFSDNGTFGKRRPQVHVTPPSLVQQQWILAGAQGQPDLIARLDMASDESTGTAVIVHVTCQIRLQEQHA